MRLVRCLSLLGLLAGVIPFTAGCGDSTEVALEKAPPVQAPPPSAPPTGETKKFGGAGSSSRITQNPGGNT